MEPNPAWWLSFLEEGMAELRPQRICSETVEHSGLGSDSQGSHPCSKSHRLCVTLGWLGNLSCSVFFIHTMEILAPPEDQTGLVI